MLIMQSAVHLLKLNFIMKKALDLMKNAMQCTCNKRNVKKKSSVQCREDKFANSKLHF